MTLLSKSESKSDRKKQYERDEADRHRIDNDLGRIVLAGLAVVLRAARFALYV